MRIGRESEGEGKRRFSPLLWSAGLCAAAILALGVNGTLSQFVASITNSNNNVQSGGPGSFGFSESLVVGGTPQTPACAQAGASQSLNCTTINKNGTDGAAATPIAPGQSRTTTVQLTNTATGTGALAGTLSLTVAPCTQNVPVGTTNPATGAAAGDLCGAVQVTVSCSSTPAFSVGPVTLTSFAAGSPYAIMTAIPPGDSVDCTFTTTLPASQSAANLQALLTSQPMTWTWTQS
jgi:hypothetical protein